MIPVRLTISINGAEPVPLKQAGSNGLVIGTLTERHLACSTLTLSQFRLKGEALAINEEESVKLYINGRCVFIGEATKNPQHSYVDRVIKTTYTIQNWWRRMERQPFLRSPIGRVEVGDTFVWPFDSMSYIMGWTDDNGTSPVTRGTKRFYCGKTLQFGSGTSIYQSSSVAVTGNLLFEYFLDRHPGLIVPPDFPWTIGLWDPKTYTLADASVAQAMQGVMRMEPVGIMRTRYENGTPKVEVLDGAIQPVRTFQLGQRPLKSASITPLGDIIPEGVSIRLSRAHFRSDYGRGFQDVSPFADTSLTQWPSTTRGDDYNMMSMSVDEADNSLDVNYGNVALKFYEQISVLAGSGDIALDDPGMRLAIQIGEQIQITGDGDIEHGRMLVQEVSHDFSTHTTTCRVGFPPPMGLNDLISRDEWARRTMWGGGRPSSLTPII